MFYVHWALDAGATAEPAGRNIPERAAYVAQGIVEIDGQQIREGQMAVFEARPDRPGHRGDQVHRHVAGRRAGW